MFMDTHIIQTNIMLYEYIFNACALISAEERLDSYKGVWFESLLYNDISGYTQNSIGLTPKKTCYCILSFEKDLKETVFV